MSSEKRIDFLDFGIEGDNHFRPSDTSCVPVRDGVSFFSISEKISHFWGSLELFNPVEIIKQAFVVCPLPERLTVAEDANQKATSRNLFFIDFRSVSAMPVKRFKIHQNFDKVVGKFHHLLAFPLEVIRDVFDNSADDHAGKTGNQSFHFNRLHVCWNNIAHVVKKTENFSVASLIFAEPSCMKEGETSGSDRHFTEQRECVKLSAACHRLKFRDGVLPSREPALEALRRVISDLGEKDDNTPPDFFREAPAIADLVLEPVDFVRPGGVFSGFPEECHEVGSEAVALALPGVHGNGGANENNSGKTVCISVFASGIKNVKQKEKKNDRISLLARCFTGCYHRHYARSVSIFRNIHRCGFFFKNIQKTALTISPACAILCVTSLETRAKAEAAAVTGDDSSEKITFAFLLLGRMGRRNPGVSFATFPTHSPLFRALGSSEKVTERPQQKEAKNVRHFERPELPGAPCLSHLKPNRRQNPADHQRCGADRQSWKEESPELSFRRSRVHEGRLARAGKRSGCQGELIQCGGVAL